jgi:hypothetical protein
MTRARVFSYVTALVATSAAFGWVHGAAVVDQLSEQHWEDQMFFGYTEHKIHGLLDCFTNRGLWPGLYRPISTNLYYLLAKILMHNRIETLHEVNVFFVVFNAWLLFWVCCEFMEPVWATVAAVFAASRQALVEVVHNTCEMQGLLYVAFGLLSCKAFLRAVKTGRRGLAMTSGVLLVLALLSKESAIAFPLLLLMWGRLLWPSDSEERRRAISWLRYPTIATAGWLAFFELWKVVLTQNESAQFNWDFTVDRLLTSFSTHLLAYSNDLVEQGHDVVMPKSAVVLGHWWLVQAPVGLLMVLLAAGLVWTRVATSDLVRPIAMGFALFVAGTLPFAPLIGRLFMRYSYLGHAGISICVGGAARAVWMIVRGWLSAAGGGRAENAVGSTSRASAR